jgi:hypothetical protein
MMHTDERVEMSEREVERSEARAQSSYPLFLGLPDRTCGQEWVHDR